MTAYAFTIFVGKDRRGFLLSIIAISGFIPYFFGFYLVFYRGFWELKDLLDGFSILILFKTTCFVVAGFTIVSGIYQVSEFVRKVVEGKLLIE